MKPADLLEPGNLPDDLQWLAKEYRLQPEDPIFLVLAWHWHRIQKSEDPLRVATMELKAAVDARFEALAEATETVTGVSEQLAELQEALETKPLGIAQRLESELHAPVATVVADVLQLKKSLAPLLQDVRLAQRRQTLAALVVGVVLGGTATAWFLL